MELLTLILTATALFLVFKRVAALALGVLAWAMLAFVGLGLVTGIPAPLGFIVATAIVWFGSQLASRLRVGHWRSSLLRVVLGH